MAAAYRQPVRSIPGRAAIRATAALSRADDCPEIDCVRSLLAADIIDATERRAAALGVGADRVLIAAGELSEEAYLGALGDALGLAFEPLDQRVAAPYARSVTERLIESSRRAAGMTAARGRLTIVISAWSSTARRRHAPDFAPDRGESARARRFRFTSAERLNRFVLRYAGMTLAARASGRREQEWPMSLPPGRATDSAADRPPLPRACD